MQTPDADRARKKNAVSFADLHSAPSRPDAHAIRWAIGRAKVPSSFDPASIITVHVGPEAEQQTFAAHASFLSTRSEFFRTALSDD
jgi:hypothetical protein